MATFTMRVFLDDDDEYTVGLRFAGNNIDFTPAQARFTAEALQKLADAADAKQLDAERTAAQAIASARRPAEAPSWFGAALAKLNPRRWA